MIRPRCTGALVSMVLAACGSLSGLDGHNHYACQAPEGIACQSVSGTYANAVAGTAAQRAPARKQAVGPTPLRAGTAATPVSTRPVAPAVDNDTGLLRSNPRVLRLWFKPWEDADHDLYDQGFVYVQVDSGRWQIDHTPRATRDASVPLRPPVARAAAVQPRPTASPAPSSLLGALPRSASRSESGNE